MQTTHAMIDDQYKIMSYLGGLPIEE
jgi:hypothetical protein